MIIAAKGAAAHSGAAGLEYRWVAATGQGLLYTCDDTTGTTWTSRTSSFGSTAINGIASNGTNLYVAVGSSGKLATSTDGITWTQQTSSFGTTTIQNVTYGLDGYWLAVGWSGKIATSTDGITWTQQTSGTTGNIYSVEWGDNLWVFGGIASGASIMRTATDPTSTWTTRTSTLSYYIFSIHYAKGVGIWVAGRDSGTTGALASSSDGLTWTARTSTITAQQNPFISNWYHQTTGSNGSVIVGATVTNYSTSPDVTIDFESSTNGTTWTNRTPADTTNNIGFNSVVSDASGLIMVAGTDAQTSTDGITWTKRGAIDSSVNCACHSSGRPAIR